MADPLSLAAAIAGLLTLAGGVAGQLRSTHLSFDETQSTLESIAKEIDSIVAVIDELERCLSQPHPTQDRNVFSPVISDLKRTLETIRAKLFQLRRSDSSARRWKRSRWIREVNRLVQRLQWQKTTVILALSGITMYVLSHSWGLDVADKHPLILKSNTETATIVCRTS